MASLLHDLRTAVRSLLSTPALTVAAVLSLGLGIGANTTVFSWLHDGDALLAGTRGDWRPRQKMGKDDYVVVGIAQDIKYNAIAEEAQPHMYLALEQAFSSGVVLHVRSGGAPAAVLASLREVVRSLDPNLPLFDARTLDEHLQTAVFAQKMGANMLGVMGLLALVLAAVGLYGVIAYAVGQRRQEMGIRLALGAAPRDLLRMVMRQGLTLTLIGLGIGLVLAFAATGVMASLLPGIAPRDPLTFVAVPLLLAAIATSAALIPARRAGAVDPVVALRYQ